LITIGRSAAALARRLEPERKLPHLLVEKKKIKKTDWTAFQTPNKKRKEREGKGMKWNVASLAKERRDYNKQRLSGPVGEGSQSNQKRLVLRERIFLEKDKKAQAGSASRSIRRQKGLSLSEEMKRGERENLN